MSAISAYQAFHNNQAQAPGQFAPLQQGVATNKYTVDLISRWSTIRGRDRDGLPTANTIKSIHVYDFDNTLFRSPLPNKQLWSNNATGLLHRPDAFVNGGWWHDDRILAATGEGIEVEEARAWEGWWNEYVVELVKLSMMQRDALTVLLTGRSEAKFPELIHRIVKSKGLSFDMMCFKPRAGPDDESIENTIAYKCMFLKDLLSTYNMANEIRVYEDRVKHVRSFEVALGKYADNVRHSDGRKILVEVKQVAELTRNLERDVEVREIKSLVDDHNRTVAERGLQMRYTVKEKVNFTGYIISPDETAELLKKFTLPRRNPYGEKVDYMCKGIVICPARANSNKDKAKVEQAGGFGTQIEFEACSFGSWENKVWAAWVRPVDPSITVQTEGEAMVVLATKGDGKPQDAKNITQWAALETFPRFMTTIAESGYYDIVEKRHYEHHKPFHKKEGGKHFGDGKHHGGIGGRFAQNGNGRGRGRGRGGGYRGRGGHRVEK